MLYLATAIGRLRWIMNAVKTPPSGRSIYASGNIPMADLTELFPGVDFGSAPGPDADGDTGCRRPVGHRNAGRTKRRWAVRPRRTSTAVLLRELRQAMDQQRIELLSEIRQLRHHRRNEHESLPAMLRRLLEIERHLRLTEIAIAPKPTRRDPMG